MTEAEFIQWCDDTKHAEWVDGEVVMMSPVSLSHARIVAFLMHLIGAFVEVRDLGEVLSEPFQARFEAQRRRRAPNIIFVSKRRRALLKRMEMDGAPDLVVEVVSPDSRTRDRQEKFTEYQEAGVREYWIIDADSRTIELYARSAKGKFIRMVEKDGLIASRVLRGLVLDSNWFSSPILPKVAPLLKKMSRKR